MEPKPKPINYSPDTDQRKEGPWISTLLKCIRCNHKWVGYCHFSGRGAECPNCGDGNETFSWLEHAMKELGHCEERNKQDDSSSNQG